jgi:uncharacterized protein (DUF305 family)
MHRIHMLSFPVLLGTTAVLLGCADQASVTAPTSGPAPAAKPVGSGAGANFERRYLPDAIDAAELIFEMAQVCMEKQGLHADLMTFGQRTATVAASDVTLLETWLSIWYGIQYTPSLSGPDQRLIERLRSLEGSDFEIEYLEAMIKQYTTSIRVEQRCYAHASTTALIGFCFDMQYAQSQDQAQMRSWLCTWYGECR